MPVEAETKPIQVYLTSTDLANRFTAELLESLKDQGQSSKEVRLVGPEQADIILFMEHVKEGPYFHAVRKCPIVKRYREKCFVVCEHAHPIPFLPGIYTGIERRQYRPDRTRTGFFQQKYPNPFVRYEPPDPKAPYLYSFVGDASTWPVRQALFDLPHKNRSYLEDVAGRCKYIRYRGTEEEKRSFQSHYVDVSLKSKFVLCPRGIAPSTVRLFETMKMGRVPVVIADEWVPPEGPDWDAFTVRLEERDVARLPDVMQAYESKAVEMGRQARDTWEAWFSPEVRLERIAEWCQSIANKRKCPEKVLRWTAYRHLLELSHLEHAARSSGRKLRRVLGKTLEPAAAQ
jgi:hypothetical protein